VDSPGTEFLRRLQELGLGARALDTLVNANADILIKFAKEAMLTTGSSDRDGLPPDTTVRCMLQGDASDACEYRNAVCFDLPTDETPVSTPVLHVVEAGRGGPLAQLVANRNVDGFSYDFADSTEPELFKPRAMPFSSSKMLIDVVEPASTVAAAVGGSFPGLVTWLDDLFVLQNSLGSHLWGWAFSVGQPLFGLLHANLSQQLQLPPLKNLLVLSTDAGLQLHTAQAWRDGTAYSSSGTDRWAREFLEALLEYSHDVAGDGDGSAMKSASATKPNAEDSAVLRSAVRLDTAQLEALVGTASAPRQFPVAGLAQVDGSPVAGYVWDWHGYVHHQELLKQGAAIVEACVAISETENASMLHEDISDFRVLYPALPTAAEGAAAVLIAAMRGGLGLELRNAVLATACALRRLHSGNILRQALDSVATAPPPSYLLPLYRDTRPNPRLWFTTRDAAFHPLQIALVGALAAAFPQFLGIDVVDNPSANALRDVLVSSLERVPHRVCAKVGVFAGTRENLVGGIAEANHLRKFAAAKLGTPASFQKWPPGRLLLVDRAAETPDSSNVETRYSRYFVNRGEMEAVILKYDLPYTLLTDHDIYRMSLAEQAQTFASHGILVVVHGATEVNAMFLPPHSAVIEVSPFLTWCPVFTRMLTASGHHTFPIFSKLKSPALSYSFTWGISPNRTEFMRMVEEFAVRCDDKGFALASSDPECWHELRMTSAHTPIHEFEHQLLQVSCPQRFLTAFASRRCLPPMATVVLHMHAVLSHSAQAMEAIGSPRFHRGSAIARLHGIPEAAPPPPLVQPNYYANRSWRLTSP